MTARVLHIRQEESRPAWATCIITHLDAVEVEAWRSRQLGGRGGFRSVV